MLRKYGVICILIVLFCTATALFHFDKLGERHVEETKAANRFIDQSDVTLSKVDNQVWVHTSYINYKGARTPSNGLVIVTDSGLLLVDTPWNNEQTEVLLKMAKEKFKQPFVKAIITHAHSDRIGGIDTLISQNINTFSTSLTQAEAEKNGYPRPENVLESGESTTIGQVNIEIYYPGEGHSKDNIVVWIPSKKLLFAGCLVKSLDELALPGHGDWGDSSLIDHTLTLSKKQN